MMVTQRETARRAWTAGGVRDGQRTVAVETPVAIVVDAVTVAVMMATPADLEDFALGFALTERLIDDRGAVAATEIAWHDDGVEARLWLHRGRGERIAARRRAIVGPTGCGLCGIESLAEAVVRPVPVTAPGPRPDAADILAAMTALTAAQPLGQATRAVHAAALWRRGAPLLVREDVGRHSALDKLVGATARIGIDPAAAMVLLTSRVSVEMVQKVAAAGVGLIVAVSAPTSLALDTATAAGITLVAVARADGFELFTHPERVRLG